MKILEQIFFRRPRILNVAHKVRLVNPTSQTNKNELEALARYAAGAKCALEIGSYQGISAGCIAGALAPDGILFCVDPWPGAGKCEDPNFIIFRRHLSRSGKIHKIRVLRGRTEEVAQDLPPHLDFAFIDGDHSWKGIETDWRLISPRLLNGAVVCLHDTAIPSTEPWRTFDSARFYSEQIASDPRFETIDTIYSMRVLRRNDFA